MHEEQPATARLLPKICVMAVSFNCLTNNNFKKLYEDMKSLWLEESGSLNPSHVWQLCVNSLAATQQRNFISKSEECCRFLAFPKTMN